MIRNFVPLLEQINHFALLEFKLICNKNSRISDEADMINMTSVHVD
jgi:hypothetical protein